MTSEPSEPRSQQLDGIIAAYLEAIESGQTPDRSQLLAQHPELAEDLRSFWYYWQRLCHSDLLTLKWQLKGVGSVAFSPDGKRMASGSEDSTVKVWDASKGPETSPGTESPTMNRR